MPFYRLYGLHFQSTFSIPALTEIPGLGVNPNVTIQLVSDGCIYDFIPKDVAQQPIALQIEPADALVYLYNTGVYLIQGGCKIVIVSAPQACSQNICQALLGIVMAVLLYQRRLYILHASTAAIHGMAIAFLGDSGAGKSSVLAALLAQGFQGIADDLTALRLEPHTALTYPGVPHLKIASEVANSLKLSVSPLQSKDEFYFSFPSTCKSSAFPLRHLYILEYGSHFLIEPISPQQAIIELWRYAGLKSVLKLRNRHHFNQVALLAKTSCLYRLRRPRDLQKLSKVGKLLKHHISDIHFNNDYLNCEMID
ncbi:MAG: hypothetical protein HC851_06970 [Acaryochloris sp. RU_4_1]|nr:hypothetical protein [Acaryochloris sp. RU_4_1]